MKSDFIIGIDMDDTIENLLDAWCAWLNNKYGFNYSNEDITDWKLQKTYTTLTEEQIFEPLYIDEFWLTVLPKPDAVKYVKKLIDDGFQVYICTNTHYSTLATKMQNVLFKYFPYLSWKNVIVMKTKSLCKFNVLVDDYTQNLIYGDYVRVLYDTPHNRDIDDEEFDLHRFSNWEQIYDFINDWYELQKGDVE